MFIFAFHAALVISALQALLSVGPVDLPLGTRTCFGPTKESEALASDQVIRCYWAHPGTYPPKEARFYWLLRRCCFSERPEAGVFWAIGESVTTRLIAFEPAEDQDRRASFEFDLDQALLYDLLVLDAATDAPVSGARVTLSNDAVHLVSAVYHTDADGYVVLPVMADTQYIASIRADSYLTPPPVQIFWPSENTDMPESVVELDPGTSLSGRVTDSDGRAVADAKIHVDVDLVGGGAWSSDIDLPLPVSSFSSPEAPWTPYRGSFSSAANGRFLLETLPRGKMHLYATHDDYAPGPVVTVDTSDDADAGMVHLSLASPRRAWVRVENEMKAAVVASLSVVDMRTGFEQIGVKSLASGALDLKNLPERARFRVSADGYVFHQEDRTIEDGDEIVITLEKSEDSSLAFKIMDADGSPMQNVTLSMADRDQQKAHPQCLAKTDSQGKALLPVCPKAFWLDIYHSDIVRELRHVTSGGPERELYLKAGSALSVEMRDEKTGARVRDVSCALETVFTADIGERRISERFECRDGMLELSHRGAQKCILSCSNADGSRSQAEFVCDQAPKALEFKHHEQRSAVVLDAFGAQVPYARILIGDRSLETDETGHIALSAEPGTKLEVYHYQHGHASLAFETGSGTLELRLPDKPDDAVMRCLDARGLKYIVDSSEILLDILNETRNLKRGDSVEQCGSAGLVVVRDGRRVHVRD